MGYEGYAFLSELVNEVALDDGTSPFVTGSAFQLAKTGTFYSPIYGKITISPQDLRTMFENFKLRTPQAPTQLPIDYDHLSDDPKQPGDGRAAGWINDLQLGEDGQSLWASPSWTAKAADLIRNGEYRFVSPFFLTNYLDKNSGQKIGPTLKAAAITNRPFLEGMQPIPAPAIAFSEKIIASVWENPSVAVPRGYKLGAQPVRRLKDFDPSVGGGVDRDQLPDEDFAGPDRSFPIKTPGDVSDAASSIGRTKHDPATIKAAIIRIAKSKGPGFVAELPDSWKDHEGASMAESCTCGAPKSFKDGRAIAWADYLEMSGAGPGTITCPHCGAPVKYAADDAVMGGAAPAPAGANPTDLGEIPPGAMPSPGGTPVPMGTPPVPGHPPIPEGSGDAAHVPQPGAPAKPPMASPPPFPPPVAHNPVTAGNPTPVPVASPGAPPPAHPPAIPPAVPAPVAMAPPIPGAPPAGSAVPPAAPQAVGVPVAPVAPAAPPVPAPVPVAPKIPPAVLSPMAQMLKQGEGKMADVTPPAVPMNEAELSAEVRSLRESTTTLERELALRDERDRIKSGEQLLARGLREGKLTPKMVGKPGDEKATYTRRFALSDPAGFSDWLATEAPLVVDLKVRGAAEDPTQETSAVAMADQIGDLTAKKLLELRETKPAATYGDAAKIVLAEQRSLAERYDRAMSTDGGQTVVMSESHNTAVR